MVASSDEIQCLLRLSSLFGKRTLYSTLSLAWHPNECVSVRACVRVFVFLSNVSVNACELLTQCLRCMQERQSARVRERKRQKSNKTVCRLVQHFHLYILHAVVYHYSSYIVFALFGREN